VDAILTRPLWIGLAALMILTPLGLLATGAAWGEWSLEDFTDPQAREGIAAASGNQAPPSQAPQGFARLASIWSAPIPDYAPPFLRSEAFGYVMSAMFGVGLIILTVLLIGRVVRRGRNPDEG
jgi:cobalt/nickel transport system permease protein